jgi:hypothetical protein
MVNIKLFLNQNPTARNAIKEFFNPFRKGSNFEDVFVQVIYVIKKNLN